MKRNEFIDKLKALLEDMPESEKNEAINYYNDYFDDAGEENEEAVIDGLGTPEQVAEIIRSGMKDDGNGSEYTEIGINAGSIKKDQISVTINNYNSQPNDSKSGSSEKEKISTPLLVLIIVLCIISSPVILTVAGAVFSIIAGIVCAALGLVCGLIGCTFAFFIGAVIGIVLGIALIPNGAFAGFLIIGISLIFAALAIFGIWLTGEFCYFCYWGFPYLIKGIKFLWGKLVGLFKSNKEEK